MKKKICITAAALSAISLLVLAGVKIKRKCAKEYMQGVRCQ